MKTTPNTFVRGRIRFNCALIGKGIQTECRHRMITVKTRKPGETEKTAMEFNRKRFEEQLDRMRLFWDSMTDADNGGFYGRADAEGKADPGADKGTILMSRILWFYSCLAMITHDSKETESKLQDNARHTFCFLKEHCLDTAYGGAFEMVHFDGTMADDRKNAYTQSFVMLALSAYACAFGSKEALSLAKQFASLLEEKFWDGHGYREQLDRSFKSPAGSDASGNRAEGSEAEIYTLGTVIQLLESHVMLYEALSETKEKETVQDRIIRLIRIMKTGFSDKKTGLLSEYASDSGLADNYISCGHNAIAALLHDRALAVLCGKEDAQHFDEDITFSGSSEGRNAADKAHGSESNQEFSERIMQLIYQYFLDPSDGAVDYELRESGSNRTRVWWAQADAAAAFYHVYAKSPDKADYLNACEGILSFTESYMTDLKTGEWTEHIRKEDPEQDLVHSWKGPYHTGRMCFEILRDMRG